MDDITGEIDMIEDMARSILDEIATIRALLGAKAKDSAENKSA